MGFSRQEYRSRLPFPTPRDLLNPRVELGSPALQADPLPSEPQVGLGLHGISDVLSASFILRAFPYPAVLTATRKWGSDILTQKGMRARRCSITQAQLANWESHDLKPL